MIVRGWRSRRPSDSWSAVTGRSSGGRRRIGGRSPTRGRSRRRRARVRGRWRGSATRDRGAGRRRSRRLELVAASPLRLAPSGVASGPPASVAEQAAHRPPRRRSAAAGPGRCRAPAGRPWRSASEPDVERGPAGDELGRRQGGQQPGRRRRVAVEDRVGDADLERVWASETAMPGQAVARARTRRPAGCRRRPIDPRVVGLDPVDLADQVLQSAASRSERAAEAVERVGDPDEAALRADRGDRLGGAAGRAGRPRSRKRQMRSPSAVWISSPTITVRPGATSAAIAARLEGAVDPVVVGDREVGQPARRRRARRTDAGEARRVEDAPEECGRCEVRRTPRPPLAVRSGTRVIGLALRPAGRATS